MKPEELKEIIERKRIIGPYDERNDRILPLDDSSCIQPIGYDVRVGDEAWLWSTQKLINPEKEPLVIRPGEVVVIKTYEHLNIPRDIAGIVKSRVTLVSLGLSHVSTTIDPTFKGYLAITVSNVGIKDICLKYKDRIATLVFFRLSGETQVPEFARAHQNLKTLLQVLATKGGISALVERQKRPEDATLEALRNEALWRGKPFDTVYYLLERHENTLSGISAALRQRGVPLQEGIFMPKPLALFLFPLLLVGLWLIVYSFVKLTQEQLTVMSIAVAITALASFLVVHASVKRKLPAG